MSWTLTTDIPVTRRKRVHQLRNETGELIATFTRLSEALYTANARDIRQLEVISPDGHWLLEFEPFPW